MKKEFRKFIFISESINNWIYYDFIDMSISEEGIIGKKGEILPKKTIRDIAGIKPGDRIYIEALPGKIMIKKIYSVEELFKRPPLGNDTLEQINKEMEEESNLQEERSIQKINKCLR